MVLLLGALLLWLVWLEFLINWKYFGPRSRGKIKIGTVTFQFGGGNSYIFQMYETGNWLIA